MVTGVIGLLERKIESKDAAQLAILFKTLGTLISVVAGYTAFPKIPIGK
jgi:hypothetical protein